MNVMLSLFFRPGALPATSSRRAAAIQPESLARVSHFFRNGAASAQTKLLGPFFHGHKSFQTVVSLAICTCGGCPLTRDAMLRPRGRQPEILSLSRCLDVHTSLLPSRCEVQPLQTAMTDPELLAKDLSQSSCVVEPALQAPALKDPRSPWLSSASKSLCKLRARCSQASQWSESSEQTRKSKF